LNQEWEISDLSIERKASNARSNSDKSKGRQGNAGGGKKNKRKRRRSGDDKLLRWEDELKSANTRLLMGKRQRMLSTFYPRLHVYGR